MIICAFDTSADDTACAITNDTKILSNVLSSQIDLHAQWGGIVPTVARRAHEEHIELVYQSALKKARISEADIDVVAVTQGPGLAITLEVGIKKAKEIAKKGKEIVAVNHISGHIYANFAQNSNGKPIRHFHFPLLCLVVSGGHTELIVMHDHHSFEIIGETLDDAAGEAFDKVGRMLGFGYPAGPVIEEIAKNGNVNAFDFPRPMEKSGTFDFSFSGLKTSVLYQIKKLGGIEKLTNQVVADIAASFQQAVIDSLVHKTKLVLNKKKYDQLLLGGGVISNVTLRSAFRKYFHGTCEVFTPPLPHLCTDNAAMIAIAAYYKAKNNNFVDLNALDRDPNMSIAS